MQDFRIVIGMHMVVLLLGAVVLVRAARKNPGFKERFRFFMYGYVTCVVLNAALTAFLR